MKTLIETIEIDSTTFEIKLDNNGVQQVIKFRGYAEDLEDYCKQFESAKKPKKSKKKDDPEVDDVVNLEATD